MTNKTTKICCTLALLASVATLPAHSQTKKFEGLSIGLGGTAIGNNTNISAADVDANSVAVDFGKTNLVPYIDASYSFALNNNWLFGFGARYDLGKNKSGDINSNVVSNDIFNGVGDVDGDNVLADIRNIETYSIKYKDHQSIYLMPIYLVNNSSAIFAKLGYHEQKGSISYKNVQTVTNNFTGDDEAIDGDADYVDGTITASGSKKFKGYGYGVGFKTLLTDNLYMQLDAEMIDYDKETVRDGDYTFGFKPKSVNASISLGYKF